MYECATPTNIFWRSCYLFDFLRIWHERCSLYHHNLTLRFVSKKFYWKRLQALCSVHNALKNILKFWPAFLKLKHGCSFTWSQKVISSIMAKLEMVKYCHLQIWKFFCHLLWDIFCHSKSILQCLPLRCFNLRY